MINLITVTFNKSSIIFFKTAFQLPHNIPTACSRRDTFQRCITSPLVSLPLERLRQPARRQRRKRWAPPDTQPGRDAIGQLTREAKGRLSKTGSTGASNEAFQGTSCLMPEKKKIFPVILSKPIMKVNKPRVGLEAPASCSPFGHEQALELDGLQKAYPWHVH